MRGVLILAAALVFGAGAALFFGAEHTAEFFAWTVTPPLTAATLGAAYWGAMVLELGAAREKSWAATRVAIPGVLVFTTLMNLPILQNIHLFHLHRPAAWAWIAVYAVVPFVMGGALWHQLRQPGGDPPRGDPLPLPLRGLLAAQAMGMLALGAGMLLAAERFGGLWPWDLSPQSGAYPAHNAPYFGCWLLGLGVVAAQVVWENDRGRLRAAFLSYAVLALLIFGALLRYARSVDWSSPGTVLYVAALGSIAVAGAWGMSLRDA